MKTFLKKNKKYLILLFFFVFGVFALSSIKFKAISPSFDFIDNSPNGYTFTLDLTTFSDYLHDGEVIDNITITGSFVWNNASYNSMYIDFTNRSLYFDSDLMYSMNTNNFGANLTIEYTSSIFSDNDIYVNTILGNLYSTFNKYVVVYIYSNSGTIENLNNNQYYNYISFTYDQTVSNFSDYYNQYIDGDYSFTRTDYSFIGLNTSPSASVGLTNTQLNNFGVNFSSVILYCVWERVQPQTYTLAYSPNGATSGTPPLINTYNTGTYINLQNVGQGSLQRTGYTFVGWNTDASASVGLTGITITSNTILYAIWSSNSGTLYTITFNGNNASGGIAPSFITEYYGRTLNLLTIGANTLVRTGYVFLGWNTNSAATTPITSVEITSDITLYAIWSNNFIQLQEKYFYFGATLSGNDFTYNMSFVSNSEIFNSITYSNGTLYYDELVVYENGTWVVNANGKTYRQILIGNNFIPINNYNNLLVLGLFIYNQEDFGYTMYDLLIGVADVPVRTITGLMNFELFGTTLLVVFGGLITVVVIIWVIKRFV